MSEKMNEIEKFLRDEQREQKITASGIRGRASRLGRVGSMKTAYDYMSSKEKRLYRKGGEVTSYNMYQEKILPLSEFKQLPTNTQREALIYWRENFGNKAIIEVWDNSTLYKYIDKLGIPKGASNRNANAKPREPKEFNLGPKFDYLKNVMLYDYVRKLPKEKQVSIMTDYVSRFSNNELLYAMKVKQSTYFSFLKRLGVKSSEVPVPEELVGYNTRPKVTNKNKKPIEVVPVFEPTPEPTPAFTPEDVALMVSQAIAEYDQKQNIKKKTGFTFNMDGVYNSADIENRFTKLSMLLDGEEKKFRISLSIEEL